MNVRAFVGVFGVCPRPPKEIREVCGQATSSIRLGSTHVTFVGRGDGAHAVDDPAGPLVLHTGRPFFEDRLLEDGPIPNPDELDGKFAYLVVDPNRLELLTDCIGAGSVFYAREGGLLYFGSHLGLLLAALPEVPSTNDVGIAAQLFVRAQVFDQTHFNGTYRLPAGGRLTAELGANQTVDMRVTPGKGIRALLDVDAPRLAPDSFLALLDRSVERERYNANSVLMLSGGHDSYLIALARASGPWRAVTYGERYSIDFVRGRRRARRLGCEFLPVPYEDWTLETYRDEIVALHAGCSGLQTAHNIVGFDWASDKADLASVGFLGDVFRGKILDKMEKGPHDTTVPPILMRKFEDPVLSDIFAKEKTIVTEYVMDTFRDLSRDVGDHKALSMLKLDWQQGREFSMLFDLCDWFLPVSYPLMQRQLIASWLQADLEDARSRRVFGLTLEHALARRGFGTDYRGGIAGRLWVRFLATSVALCSGKRVALRCDWQAVNKRSRAPYADSACRHHRLSELTQRTWQRVLSGEDKSPLPIAYRSAAMVAACEHFLPQGQPLPADAAEDAESDRSEARRVSGNISV